MTDAVLERLRAADPIDDLDAVARGVAALPAQPPTLAGAPRPSRATLALTASAIAVALAVALVGVPDPANRADGPAIGRLDVAEAAARALAPGTSILYYKMHITQHGPGRLRTSSISEAWVAPGGRVLRARSTTPAGRVHFDERVRYAGIGDAPSVGPLEVVRGMLRDGSLRPAGTVTGADGRRLRKLTTTRRQHDVYLVDATTFEPVRVVTHVRRPGVRLDVTTAFLAFEHLPDDAGHRRLLQPPRQVPFRPHRGG